ncbi:MAG: tachylectin-related carbohydrate-binding protein [Polyangiales bacterium]
MKPSMAGFSAQARAEQGGQWGKRFGGLTGAVALVALSCAPLPGEPGAVGQQASEIINGTTPSLSYAAPFGVVRLNLFNGGICSGTIVNASYILTAAHCWAGSIPYQNGLSVSTILYEDGSPTGQVRQSDSFNVLTIPWSGGGSCGDVTLVHLSQPFNIQNTRNPDAPFVRNMYSDTIQSLVGQTANIFGYGITQPGVFDNSNPPNCSTASTAGSLRQAFLPITSVFNPPVGSCGGYSFYMGPNSGNPQQALGPGDSGSGALVGPTGFETLAGVSAIGNCSIGSTLMGGPEIFRDGVMNTVGAHNSAKALYGITNGNLSEYWHTQQASYSGVWQYGQVGSGWSFRDVTNDGSVMYAVDTSGNLHWYRHDGHYDVYAGHWGPRAGTVVGGGWNSFRHLVAGGDGVLYAVDGAGTMYWYRHNAKNIGQFDLVNVGQAPWTYGAPSGIGTGMTGYTHITSPGNGVFYLRTSSGALYWTKYANHATGAYGGFAPAVFLRTLPSVVDIVAKPGGYIYYSDSSGTLREFRHEGWQTGALTWGSPSGTTSTPYDATVGSGWQNTRILGSGRYTP